MPILPIPINTNVYKNVDGIELNSESSALIDGYRSSLGSNVSRPGLSLIYDCGLSDGKSCQGIYWWDKKQCYIFVMDTKVYKATFAGTTITVTDLSGDLPNTQSICTFADDGTYLFIANGGRILYTDSVTPVQYIADADAPLNCTHVAYLDGYLLANLVGTPTVQFSDNESPLAWDAGNYFSAVSNGDDLTALHVFNQEVYLVGPKSVEIWQDDGTTPFSPVSGGILEAGCKAKNSVINTDKGIFFFDEQRRLVVFNGRNIEAISGDYDKEIEEYNQIDDCHSLKFKIGGIPFLCFQFPTAGKSLLYNYRDQTWSEWGRWESEAGQYERWLGAGYAYSPDYNIHLVGSRRDSKLYIMSHDYISDEGEEIRLYRETGHIDWGTHKRKRCNGITLRLKCGDDNPVVSGQTRTLTLEVLDDNKVLRTRLIDLADIGNTELIKTFNVRGIYQTRKYSLTSTAPVNIVIKEAFESFDVLR